jgi:hypothetical protein
MCYHLNTIFRERDEHDEEESSMAHQPQQTSPTAADYYSLGGEPLTLERTARVVGIGLSTLQKRRSLLKIRPLRGVKRGKFIRPEDIVFLQYMERHPYLLTPELTDQPQELEELRSRVLDELRGERQES